MAVAVAEQRAVTKEVLSLQEIADRLERVIEDANDVDDGLEDDDLRRLAASSEIAVPYGEAARVASALATLKLDIEIAIRRQKERADGR